MQQGLFSPRTHRLQSALRILYRDTHEAFSVSMNARDEKCGIFRSHLILLSIEREPITMSHSLRSKPEGA